MTKERYEELKKQGGTIWHYEYGEIRLEDTDISETRDLSNNIVGYTLLYFGEGYDVFLQLEDLEEDPTKGKWKHKMTAERIERFEPPMWEDLKEYYFDFINNEKDYPTHWSFDCHQTHKTETSIGVFLYNETSGEYEIYEKDATKENYEKACKMVRDLFKGEK